MSAPRHLWSGDWQRESAAAAAEQRAERRGPTETPADPPAPEPPAGRRLRRAALIGAAGLVLAVAAYGAISATTTSGTPSSPAAQRASAPGSGQAWLGVDATSLPITTGAMIVDVAPGGPADAAGLQPGDVITAVGSHPVQSPADLGSALAGLHAGQRVQIDYQLGPGQSTYTTQAVLQSRPAGP